MSLSIQGIHHITIIAGPPQQNYDFYNGFLGLRLVKRTVNFDDPYTYHLYYGDDAGNPGTILTFFPWSDAFQGKPGTGKATVVQFQIPKGSLDYWITRFSEEVIDFGAPFLRFGQQVIPFKDPDGLKLELIESMATIQIKDRKYGPISPEYAIQGFFGVTLVLGDAEPTAQLLEEVMGYKLDNTEHTEQRFRYRAAGEEPGIFVDLQVNSDLSGRMGKGTIHHVAFRAKDKEEQLKWQELLTSYGYEVTEVRDRNYFTSIYFYEPGGVLFEIATDSPGFAVDEPVETLGSSLKLPEWLEPNREMIEKRLIPLNTK